MNHLKAICCMSLSSIFIVISDILMKSLNLPIYDILFLRFLLATIILLPSFNNKTLNFNNFLRAILFSFSMFFFLQALHKLPLAIIITINFTIPIWVTIFSKIILKENIKNRLSIVLFCFLGVAITCSSLNNTHFDAIIKAIISTIFFASLDIFNKYHINKKEELQNIIAGSSFFSTLIFLPFFSLEIPKNILPLIYLGINSNLIFFFLIKAMQYSEISALQPIRYIEFPLSAISGYIFFQEELTIRMFLGFAIITGTFLINLKN